MQIGSYRNNLSNFYNGPNSDDEDFLPVIPKLPIKRWPSPPKDQFKPIAKCGECGLKLYTVMGYVCPRQNCPCFPQATC